MGGRGGVVRMELCRFELVWLLFCVFLLYCIPVVVDLRFYLCAYLTWSQSSHYKHPGAVKTFKPPQCLDAERIGLSVVCVSVCWLPSRGNVYTFPLGADGYQVWGISGGHADRRIKVTLVFFVSLIAVER